jgi:hypothetical protein
MQRDPALQRIDEQSHRQQVGTSSGAQAPGDERRMQGSGPRAPVRGADPGSHDRRAARYSEKVRVFRNAGYATFDGRRPIKMTPLP